MSDHPTLESLQNDMDEIVAFASVLSEVGKLPDLSHLGIAQPVPAGVEGGLLPGGEIPIPPRIFSRCHTSFATYADAVTDLSNSLQALQSKLTQLRSSADSESP